MHKPLQKHSSFDGETPLQRAEKIQAAGLGDYSEVISLLKEAEGK